MKKLDENSSFKDVLDAVNELSEKSHFHSDNRRAIEIMSRIERIEKKVFDLPEGVGFAEQTQEPESKIHGKNWDDPTPMPHAMDEKEPECEHEWEYWKNYAMKRCKKCNEQMPLGKFDKKPAKKECLDGVYCKCDKDELAERLFKIWDEVETKFPKDIWLLMADEARKWAVEAVEKVFRESDQNYESILLDEVLARLKESK